MALKEHKPTPNIVIGYSFRGFKHEREFIPNGDAFKKIEFRFLPRTQTQKKTEALRDLKEVSGKSYYYITQWGLSTIKSDCQYLNRMRLNLTSSERELLDEIRNKLSRGW